MASVSDDLFAAQPLPEPETLCPICGRRKCKEPDSVECREHRAWADAMKRQFDSLGWS